MRASWWLVIGCIVLAACGDDRRSGADAVDSVETAVDPDIAVDSDDIAVDSDDIAVDSDAIAVDADDIAVDSDDVAVDSDVVPETSGPDPCRACVAGESCVAGVCVCERAVSDAVRFDIPVATVTVRVTFGGGAFVDRPDVAEQGALDLRDASGELLRLITFTPADQDALVVRAKVVPGRYDLYYAAVTPNGVELPANARVLLVSDVDVVGDTTIAADLPFVDQRFVVTFRGGGFPDVPGDGATLALHDRRIGANGPLGRAPLVRFETRIMTLTPAGQPDARATVRLVPGAYDLAYDSRGHALAAGGLPLNGLATLGAVVVTGAQPIAVDLAPLDVTVTLAPRSAVAGAQERAWAQLDSGDGHPIQVLAGVPADGTAHTGEARVLPGRYDVVAGAPIGPAPNAAPAAHPLGRLVLEDALVDASHTHFDLALEGAATTFSLTLDGGPFIERFGGTNDVGAVFLVTEAGVQLPLFAGITATGMVPGRVIDVLPGRYDVLWQNTASSFLHGSEIPVGQAWLARDLLLGDAPREVALDVPTVEVTFDLTLGGGPLPSMPDTDDGADVWLEDPLGRLDPLFEGLRASGDGPSVTRLVVPGAYRVIYASRDVSSFENPRRYGEALPVSDRRVVAELVLDEEARVAVDLRFATVAIAVGYDGGPFPSPSPPTEPMVLALGGDDPVVLFRSFSSAGQASVARTLRLLEGSARLYYQRSYFFAPSVGVEVPANPDRAIGCLRVLVP